MDEDSRVGEVKKSNRVRGIFCSIWKTPYHRNCNCLAEEIDDISKQKKLSAFLYMLNFTLVIFQ